MKLRTKVEMKEEKAYIVWKLQLNEIVNHDVQTDKDSVLKRYKSNNLIMDIYVSDDGVNTYVGLDNTDSFKKIDYGIHTSVEAAFRYFYAYVQYA